MDKKDIPIYIGDASSCVSRSFYNFQSLLPELDSASFLDEMISLASALLTQDRLTSRNQLLQPASSCDVVCVDMGVHHVLQGQPHLLDQLDISLRVLNDWIYQDCLLGLLIRQEVGVGAGLLVEQLSEYLT